MRDSDPLADGSRFTDGLDLDITATEKSVGRYKVDILAQISDDERTVVIENQLEQSDHDHLGKAIAYAAGVDAAIVVWIAPRFNNEHRDAIEWLNRARRVLPFLRFASRSGRLATPIPLYGSM